VRCGVFDLRGAEAYLKYAEYPDVRKRRRLRRIAGRSSEAVRNAGSTIGTRYNSSMAFDWKLPGTIFAILAAVIALPFLIGHQQERRRPVLAEARVVTATESDSVFREGPRHPAPGETVEAALAIRITRQGRDDQWLAPVGELVINGVDVAHTEMASWPDDGRVIRVFWFSIESTNLGGRLTAENAGKRLRYRTYLAPEMGRGLRAARMPDSHNDDHIGRAAVAPGGAGTVRLYARVEVVEKIERVQPLQAVTTLDVSHIFEPGFPALFRAADLAESVRHATGELFGLPGFEPEEDSDGSWDDVTVAAFDRQFTELVSERIMVSSWTLAAVAVSGTPDLDPTLLSPLGGLSISDDRILRRGRPLVWEEDISSGDLLVHGSHWFVLLGDNGNGVLDTADTILHSWGRPPERTTLFAALDPAVTSVDLLRYAP